MEILDIIKVPYYKKGKAINKNKSLNVETPVDNEETYFLGTLPEVEITTSASPETIRKGWELLTNEWALQNPTAIFKPKYRKQRAVLTDDTWRAIIKANNITDPADKRFKMIPTKFLEEAMLGDVRKAINETGTKVALEALAVPAGIIGGAALATKVLPAAGRILTQVGEKAYPFVSKYIAPTLNKLDPFSKEFASMSLAGKSAVGALESMGLAHGINTTVDFVKDPSVDKIPELVMADMAALPYGLAAGLKLYGLYNKASAPFRIARQLNKNIDNTVLPITTISEAKVIPAETVSHPNIKTSLKFYERPSTLTEAEKLGIPKGERTLYLKGTNADPSYYSAIGLKNPRYLLAIRDHHFKLSAGINDLITGYHGQPSDKFFYQLDLMPYSDMRSSGYFSSSSLDVGNSYHGVMPTPGLTFKVYLNLKNPYIYDNQGRMFLSIKDAPILQGKILPGKYPTDKIYPAAINEGYDGAILQNVEDVGMKRLPNINYVANDYITGPGKAKLADPIVEDGLFQIIPLSKRDNFSIPDIRFKQGGTINYLNPFNPFNKYK